MKTFFTTLAITALATGSQISAQYPEDDCTYCDLRSENNDNILSELFDQIGEQNDTDLDTPFENDDEVDVNPLLFAEVGTYKKKLIQCDDGTWHAC